MKNEQFRPKTPQDDVGFSEEKQKIINDLLEQHKFHTDEKKRLEGELAMTIIDKSDSENRDEQMLNRSVINDPVLNPIADRIKEEDIEIKEIESQIAKQAGQ